ncbi:hypothetical protein H5410_058266 [Solanum commersonii]|uniref:Uncharacterized protein n=1 Tax=Solanum commersonii TaxID=4109 RepID=A0A9J5WSL6_SOLCO|nr:hypothetical protein H5410_058266 [Solanum commersonii]
MLFFWCKEHGIEEVEQLVDFIGSIVRPIVPVPQQTSKSKVSGPKLAQSPAREYNFSAARVLNRLKERNDNNNILNELKERKKES